MTRPLYPPLEQIERDLFDHAFAPHRGDDAGDIDPVWCGPGPNPAMPMHLLSMIERRSAAQGSWASGPPAAGQIRQIVAVREASGARRSLGRTCGVLLRRQARAGCWAGWLVAQESDWASGRDLILQEDDGPVAPEAAMVQAWNPVTVAFDGDEPVLGQVSPDCLETVRKLAASQGDGDTLARPGRIGAWNLDAGTTVVTGTPLVTDDDPRHRYQALYHTLAEQLGVAAEHSRALGHEQRLPARDGWVQRLRAFFVRPAWTAGLAALAALQAALLLSVGLPEREEQAVYRGAPASESDAACRTTIRLMFKVGTPVADVVATLRGAGARLVGGPSETGELWAVAPSDREADETARVLRQSRFVEQSEVVTPRGRQCKR